MNFSCDFLCSSILCFCNHWHRQQPYQFPTSSFPSYVFTELSAVRLHSRCSCALYYITAVFVPKDKGRFVKSQHAVVVLTLGNVNADKGYILWFNFRSTRHRNLPGDPQVDGQGSPHNTELDRNGLNEYGKEHYIGYRERVDQRVCQELA